VSGDYKIVDIYNVISQFMNTLWITDNRVAILIKSDIMDEIACPELDFGFLPQLEN